MLLLSEELEVASLRVGVVTLIEGEEDQEGFPGPEGLVICLGGIGLSSIGEIALLRQVRSQ